MKLDYSIWFKKISIKKSKALEMGQSVEFRFIDYITSYCYKFSMKLYLPRVCGRPVARERSFGLLFVHEVVTISRSLSNCRFLTLSSDIFFVIFKCRFWVVAQDRFDSANFDNGLDWTWFFRSNDLNFVTAAAGRNWVLCLS